jgi:hypothetical protein
LRKKLILMRSEVARGRPVTGSEEEGREVVVSFSPFGTWSCESSARTTVRAISLVPCFLM